MLLLSQNNDNLVDCTKAVQNKPNDKNWTEKSFLKQMALCRKEDFSIILCACQAPLSWNSPGKNTGVGCHALLQEIFPIQGSNISLLSLLNWQVGSLPLVPPREPFPWTGQWIHLLLFDHIPCILLSTLRRNSVQFSSVQSLSRVRLSATPWIAARQASCPSPTLGVHQTHVHRVGDAIQPSHPLSSPFSSCPQSLPASESFPMSQLVAWGGQSTGVSASASFPAKKSQDWSPSKWTGWISLQSKGLSRVFSKTTVQKHQFFGAQLSSQSNSHIHRWPLERP